MGLEGSIRGREGVCEKRTREPFHLWPINAEEHLHTINLKALPNRTHRLCCLGDPHTMSQTSEDAHPLFLASEKDTLGALFKKC